MRILFMGDASNYHNSLAKALRDMGHDVTVASNGSHWMNTGRDISLRRPVGGKLGGALLMARLDTLLRHRFKGYDIVQISNPVFLDLKPHRVKTIFNRLKRDNGSVFLSGLGTDNAYIRMCMFSPCPLRYTEWFVNGKPSPYYNHSSEKLNAWLQPPLSDHCKYIYENIDGVITALYEYDLAYRQLLPDDMVAYGGIPIDVKNIGMSVDRNVVPERVSLFMGMHRHRKLEKGTDRMCNAAKRVKETYPDKCELKIVENLPYSEFLEQMSHSHIAIDQLYSYTPATSALLAMAMGLTTVSGGEPEYYDFIGERDNHPIINALPDDDALYAALEHAVLNPQLIPERALDNRNFVLKHNESHVVATRFVDFWLQKLNR